MAAPLKLKCSGIEWLGQIPTHWEVKSLRRFRCLVQTGPFGSQLHAHEYETGKTPVVNPVNLVAGRIVPNEDNTVGTSILARLPHQRLKVGDIVFSRRGELGRCALVTEREAGWLCGTGSMIVRLHHDDFDAGFLSRYLSLQSVKEYFEMCSIGAIMDSLSSETLLAMPLLLPPLAEQQAISSFLNRKCAQIDALIAKKQKLIDRLQEKRQAFISHAVTKGLDPHARMKDSGIEWLKEVPAHWMIRRFRHCGTIPNGQVDPRLPAYRDMVLIAPNHIESETGRLLQTETAFEQGAESGKYVAQKGDVIYSKIRPELQKACIAPERCLCSADMYPITPKPDMVAEYILYNLLCDWFTKYAVLWSDRVAMPKVNRETFGNCFMVVPPLAEQHDIVRHIKEQTEHIDKMTDRIRVQITKLQEYRQTLISAAVTGKIDVTKAGS